MKKFILLFAIAFSFNMSAQTEFTLTKNVVDDFTGDVIKSTSYEIVGKGVGAIKAKLANINGNYYIYMYSLSDLGCSGARGNSLKVRFVDGSVLDLGEDIADIDCADYAVCIFRIDDVNAVQGKSIDKIRLTMSEYYDDINVNSANFFEDAINILK